MFTLEINSHADEDLTPCGKGFRKKCVEQQSENASACSQ